MVEDKLGFLKNYPDINAEPLWTVMEAMVPPIPSPKSVPHVWEYQKLRPALIESGNRIKAEEAERRVLMLINPTMSKLIFFSHVLHMIVRYASFQGKQLNGLVNLF